MPVGAAVLPDAETRLSSEVERLFEQYSRDVFTLVYRLVGDREVAWDLTQETFLNALRSYSRFRGEASGRTWLYRIALNSVYARGRRIARRREEPLLEADEVDATRSIVGSDPEAELLQAERRAAVRRALLNVPLKLRTVLVLKDVAGLTYEEIAAVTKLRPGTIASRLNRARLQLAARLSGFERAPFK
jgi:RNA polymerase sigma-70 factor (ECF subfamily)